VKVVQDLDGKVLFNGALARGETRSFPKQGRLLITVEIGKNLRTEVNGRNYPVPIDGYGRYALD
jgi:cytoskeleton protein RodZ